MDPRCIVFTQKADIPPCLGKIFKLKTYRLLQDALVSQKKLKEDIFNHAPPPPLPPPCKTLPGFYHHPPGSLKLLISPKQFFENLFAHIKKVGRKLCRG